ncbi:MAG TPA: PKD domain-containing protein [Flavobacteriales bacterium]|nr:PKD domain-containing protein [Flavobacteriales bacterium]
MYKTLFLFTILFSGMLTFAQTTWTVTVGGNMNTTPYFDPQFLIIDEGDIVKWDCIQGTHNINGEIDSFPANPEYFSYALGTGQGAPWNYSFTFNTSGVYDYNCSKWDHYKTQFGTITVNSSSAQTPIANFTASPTSITAGNSTDFTDLSANNPTSWSWTFNNGVPGASTDQHPTGIAYNTPGSFDVTLAVTNGQGSDTLVQMGYIEVAAAAEIEEKISNDNLIIYPNPFNKSAKLVFPNNEQGLYELFLYDMIGNKVNIIQKTTENHYVLEKGNLSTGVYFIEIQGTVKTFRDRIIVE